jgi:hypothetical protein
LRNVDASEKIAGDIPPEKNSIANAWQPFTPRGVAQFARSPASRVVFLKAAAALVATLIVIWFLKTNYFPSISEAVKKFPDNAVLENGILTNVASGILSQKKFLSAVVDLEETERSGQTADVQVEFRRDYFQICSLLGCGMFEYPPGKIVLGSSSAEPWWGARQPVILAICGITTAVFLWFVWVIFAIIYAPIAKLIAYFADRQLAWRESWRLVSAAQMPGAFLMSLAILLYGLQLFDLIRFLFFFIVHFFVAWIYICSAPFFLPRVSDKISAAKNPFG